MSVVRLKEEPVIVIELCENDIQNLYDIVRNRLINVVYYDHQIMSSEDVNLKMDEGIYICAFVDKVRDKDTIGLYWSIKRPVLRKQFLTLLSDYNLFTRDCEDNLYKTFMKDMNKAIEEHQDDIFRMSESIGIPYKVEIKVKEGYN